MFDIGISLGFEGSTDEQIVAGLKAVKNAVEGVIVSDEELAKAQEKMARSAVALEEQINRNIKSYMSSSSAIYAATAEELGYGKALKQKLDLLRQLEQHEATAKKNKKDSEKAARDEKQAIRELAAEIKELERVEAYRIAAKLKGEKEAAAILEKLGKDRMALERQLAEVEAQIAATQIADAQRVALEQIAWSRKSVQERIAALEELKLMQGTPGITPEYIAGKFGAGAMGDGNLVGYKTQAATAIAAAEAEKRAMAEIDWANKSWRERERISSSVTQMLENASISQEAIIRRYGQVAIAGSKNQEAHVNAYRANLEKLEKGNHGANKSFLEMLQGLAGNARARSEIIVLLHELMTGQFKRFGQSLIVLAEYGGAANFVLSATGLAIIGIGAALVTTAILMAKGSLEFDHLNSVLAITGGYAGSTSQGFYQMARSISSTHGTIGHAKEIMFALAESGRFTNEQVRSIAPAIQLMAEASHTPIAELVKRFESLGKSPVAASIALSEQFHYLTVEVYEQIAAMERQGNHQGAALLAQKTYAEEGSKRAEELLKHLGNVAKAWNAITRSGSAAISTVMGWGAPEMDALGKINDTIAKLQKRINPDKNKGVTQSFWDAVDRNDLLNELATQYANREKLLKDHLAKTAVAEQEARDKARQDRAVAAQVESDKEEKRLYTPQQKREENIAIAHNNAATELADFLRKKGINQIAIEEASKFEESKHRETTEVLLKQAASRHESMKKLAKQFGIDISVIEAQTALIIDEANKRNRDRVTPNSSFITTNARVKAAEDDFKDAERTAKAEIAMLEKTYTTEQRIASDRLAQDRAVAKDSNELRLVGLASYETYINRIEELTDERVSRELLQVQNLRHANRERYFLEQESFGQQKTTTGPDRERVNAAAAASLQKYVEQISRLNELERSLRDNGTNSFLTAQADTFRLMTQDLTQVHGSLEKVYDGMLRQYRTMGLTAEQTKLMDVQEKRKQQSIIESALIETETAITGTTNNEKKLKELKDRELMLRKILEIFKALGVLEDDIAKKKGTPLQAGIRSYLSSMEDGFTATEKAVAKAFKGMEDSIAKWVMTGKGGSKDLANSIISDMLRIAAQQYISGPFARMALAWMSGGTSAAGGFADTTNSPILDLIKGGRTAGGSVSSNSAFRVNEDGPELLEVGGKSYLMMGSQGGNVVPNNRLGGGGQTQQISITINQTVGDVATVSMLQQSNAALVRQIRGSLARSQKYAGEIL
ncbi:COG5281 Phage-related minor tail protein [uncultured Caudovirales phage]|uniref:COG5281 Phage-related minor tail protein n=1 Tax=uncultured Caudovirales phage TaxID=2100421 RepID=A0A6J5RQA2_9CAUD|nr:COG5281 Phage-related minor tail protein [uncultured Caudovirales phage]